MTFPTPRSLLVLLAPALVATACTYPEARARQESPVREVQASLEEEAMLVQYLEIVTPDVEATCDALEQMHGVTFGEPDPGLGNARTAALEGGGRIGVRAPLREDEEPVVRPYLLVDDIEAAVKAAEAAGGQVAVPPTEIEGHGRFAIYFLGGIQHGLWQL
jgi:predicted enzyme related to lactoylglutathione lyase